MCELGPLSTHGAVRKSGGKERGILFPKENLF